MADTIIVKFQSEGIEQLSAEVETASDKMELFDKAQKIINQSTDNLTKKQLELREQISSIGGIVKKMNETGRTSSTLYTELTTKLQKLIVEYQNESKELKKVTLDSNNYAKILTQVANGEVSAREASKLLKEEFIKLKLQGKQNTDQFTQLRQVAGELSDAVFDTSAEIKQAGSDTKGLDHVLRVATTVTAGFGLVQGATALFGSENKELEKTLIKVNAAMLVLNSLQQIQEELTKKDTKLTVIATFAKNAYAKATAFVTSASVALRIALSALGIGALIAVIYAAVKAYQSLTSETSRFNKAQEEVNTKAVEASAKEIAQLDILKNALESENISREKKLELIDDAKNQFPEILGNLQDEEFFTNKLSDAINRQKDVILLRAKARAAEELIVEETQKQLKREIEGLSTGDYFNVALKSIFKGGGISGIFSAFNDEVTESQVKINTLNKIFQQAVAELDNLGIGIETAGNKDAFKTTLSSGNKVVKIVKDELPDVFKELDAQIKSTEDDILYLFSIDKEKGLDPTTNPMIIYLSRVLSQLKKDKETIQAEFNAIVNPQEIEELIPKGLVDIPETKNLLEGLKPKEIDKPLTFLDRIFGRSEDVLKRKAELKSNAEDAISIVENMNNIATGIGDIATKAASIRAQNELQLLEDKKNKGLISQKEFEKQSAKIKNEAAQKQRNADIAMAAAKIPMAVLQAYISGLQFSPIVAGILAGIAGAFATAQVALIASAPLPKFFKGVLGLKLGNNPKGRDTIPAMLNEGESVMTTDETSKYYKELKAMRDNKFHQLYIPISKLLKPDFPVALNVGSHLRKMKGNTGNEIEVMQELRAEFADMKTEFSFLGSYIKQGNTERVRGNNKLIKTIEKTKENGY